MSPDTIGGNYFGTGKSWITQYGFSSSASWWKFQAHDIQISTDSIQGVGAIAPVGTRTNYLMNLLGNAFGLGDPGDSITSEIMSWGGDGGGSWREPSWGEGDKIAFGLVGAGNGCL